VLEVEQLISVETTIVMSWIEPRARMKTFNPSMDEKEKEIWRENEYVTINPR